MLRAGGHGGGDLVDHSDPTPFERLDERSVLVDPGPRNLAVSEHIDRRVVVDVQAAGIGFGHATGDGLHHHPVLISGQGTDDRLEPVARTVLVGITEQLLDSLEAGEHLAGRMWTAGSWVAFRVRLDGELEVVGDEFWVET